MSASGGSRKAAASAERGPFSQVREWLGFGFLRAAPLVRAMLPSIVRLARPLSRRLLPLTTEIDCRIRDGVGAGLWLRVRPRYEAQYWRGDYEYEVQHLLEQMVHAGDVVYDIGAHAGFFAVIAARLVGDTGAVFAFEPDPANAARIERAATLNDFFWLSVTRSAAWHTKGKAHFALAGNRSSRNTGAVVSGGAAAETGVVEVDAVTLDAHCGRTRPPTLIKVDVEGAEASVLKGAVGTLRFHHPTLILELHNASALDSVQQVLSRYVLEHLPHSAGSWPTHVVARATD